MAFELQFQWKDWRCPLKLYLNNFQMFISFFPQIRPDFKTMLPYLAALQKTARSPLSSDESKTDEKGGHHEAKLMEAYKSTSGDVN